MSAQKLCYWLTIGGIAIFLVLFGYHSLTRTRGFTPDSMNYVDVARHIADGRGIVQSTVSYDRARLKSLQRIPAPLTSHPPVYPVVIALFRPTGIPLDDAALLVSVVAYGLVLLLSYSLARRLYGEKVALVVAGLLLLYRPLRTVAGYAWSEPLGLVLLLTSLHVLLSAIKGSRHITWRYAAAGLIAGMTFATRYALAPIIVVGLVGVVKGSGRSWQVRLANLVLYTAGVALTAGALLWRNWRVSGLLLPSLPPSNESVDTVLESVYRALFRLHLDLFSTDIEIVLFLGMILLAAVILYRQDRLIESLHSVFVREGRYLLTLWVVAYSSVLILQKLRFHFDAVGQRLIFPAGVVLLVLWAAFVVSALRIKVRYLRWGLSGVVAFMICFQAWQLAHSTPVAKERPWQQSERLRWVAQNTTDQDLIIGNYTIDIPFHLCRRAVISISNYPYTDFAEYEAIVEFVDAHCHEFERIYWVLPTDWSSEEEWERYFGPFVTDLVYQRWGRYPRIDFRERVAGALIFEMSCSPSTLP